MDPCEYPSCPVVNGATCVADYCGGCNARWFNNGKEVNDQCQGIHEHNLSSYKQAFHIFSPGFCSGSSPANCLVNPCTFATCPGVNGATCVADYCGGCNARWFNNGKEVTDQCQGMHEHNYSSYKQGFHIFSPGFCSGSSPANCLVNPCTFATCPGVNGATCVADYCGGCDARWLLNGQEVTDQCQGQL